MNDRPDFSDFLGHFTTDRAPCSASANNPTAHVKGQSAYDRLISILESKEILASRLPWNGREAVCFTECPWSSLIDHAKRYSPYGIGFSKPHIFAAGGGPAYYVRADHYQKQQWDDHVHTFVTPFWPPYRPASLRNNGVMNNKNVDYSHEREWRVPHKLTFEYKDVCFVVVSSYEDMAKFPKALKDSIGRENFLIMENYKNIAAKWPIRGA